MLTDVSSSFDEVSDEESRSNSCFGSAKKARVWGIATAVSFFLLYLSSSIWLGVALCMLCRSGSWNSKSLWRIFDSDEWTQCLLEQPWSPETGKKNAVTQMSSSEINWIRKPLQAGISQKKRNKICYLTQWSCLKNTLVFQAKMQISIVIWLLWMVCFSLLHKMLRSILNEWCQPVYLQLPHFAIRCWLALRKGLALPKPDKIRWK